VRFATFNLMSGRSLDDGLVDPERVAAAVAKLDADVLALQEVDRDQPRSGHADLSAVAAEALGADHVLFVPAIAGTPGSSWRSATEADLDVTPAYGVALLSRWPVSRWRVVRLPAAPVRSPVYVPKRLLWLDDEPRVLIVAVVETPRGPWTVACTHLSFVPGWNVHQLRIALRALATMPGPRLLLGDLNLPGWAVAPVSGWRRLAARPTFPSPSPKVQVDHILLDRRGARGFPAVRQVSTPAVGVSDHRPLTVDLSD
jgi:endonuclease/exonuclease/phosphatase family metal-dependent hydrolase